MVNIGVLLSSRIAFEEVREVLGDRDIKGGRCQVWLNSVSTDACRCESRPQSSRLIGNQKLETQRQKYKVFALV